MTRHRALRENVTSSTIPEVHNISERHHSHITGNMHENWVHFGRVVFGICDVDNPISRGEVININMKL